MGQVSSGHHTELANLSKHSDFRIAKTASVVAVMRIFQRDVGTNQLGSRAGLRGSLGIKGLYIPR
jgi:hypothetical protein